MYKVFINALLWLKYIRRDLNCYIAGGTGPVIINKNPPDYLTPNTSGTPTQQQGKKQRNVFSRLGGSRVENKQIGERIGASDVTERNTEKAQQPSKSSITEMLLKSFNSGASDNPLNFITWPEPVSWDIEEKWIVPKNTPTKRKANLYLQQILRYDLGKESGQDYEMPPLWNKRYQDLIVEIQPEYVV